MKTAEIKKKDRSNRVLPEQKESKEWQALSGG
jgi:hypothetical protein